MTERVLEDTVFLLILSGLRLVWLIGAGAAGKAPLAFDGAKINEVFQLRRHAAIVPLLADEFDRFRNRPAAAKDFLVSMFQRGACFGANACPPQPDNI